MDSVVILMSFNPNYTVLKTITVPNPGAGALPATWSMFYNSTTPADAAGYPVVGGKIWQSLTSLASPFGHWNSDNITYNPNTRYIRASASLRQSGYTGPGTGRGGILLTLIVGTRGPADGWGIMYSVGMREKLGAAPALDLGALWMQFPDTLFPQDFAPNTWHRFGIELLGRTINGYVDTNGYNIISDVPGDQVLTYFGSIQAPEDTSDNIYVGFGIGGSFTTTNYSGIGDILIEKLTPLGGGVGGSSDPSGTPVPTTSPPPAMTYSGLGGFQDFTGPTGVGDWFGPIDFGYETSPLRKLDAENAFAYRRFKNTRAATNTLNNLVLQP